MTRCSCRMESDGFRDVRDCPIHDPEPDLSEYQRPEQKVAADAFFAATPAELVAAPEPASSNPGSKLEQVGAAGGGLSRGERDMLAGALWRHATGDHEEPFAAVERIVREREAAAWDTGYNSARRLYRGMAIDPRPANPYRSADR